MMYRHRNILSLEIITIIILFGIWKDANADWMATKGCRSFQLEGRVSYYIRNNKPETCLGRCPENTTYIAMQGRRCLCEDSLKSEPSYSENCVPCTADQGNCTVTNETLWLVYEKVSALQLKSFNLSHLNPKASMCLVVKTVELAKLKYMTSNCSLPHQYVCYMFSNITLTERCQTSEFPVEMSPFSTVCPKREWHVMERVTTENQLQVCDKNNVLGSYGTVGRTFWLGIEFIKRQVPPTTTLPTTPTSTQTTLPPITSTSLPTQTTSTPTPPSTQSTQSTSVRSSTVTTKLSTQTPSRLTTSAPKTTKTTSSIQKQTPTPKKMTASSPTPTPKTSADSSRKASADAGTEKISALTITLAVTGGALLLTVTAALLCFARQIRFMMKNLFEQRDARQEVDTEQIPDPWSFQMRNIDRSKPFDEISNIEEQTFKNAARFPASASVLSGSSCGSTLRETTVPDRKRANSEAYSPSRPTGYPYSDNEWSMFPGDSMLVYKENPVFSNPNIHNDVEPHNVQQEQSSSVLSCAL